VSISNLVRKQGALTLVLGVGAHAHLGFFVLKQSVHLNLSHQQRGGGQLVLLGLDQGDLLVEHRKLAETHLLLHAVESLEIG